VAGKQIKKHFSNRVHITVALLLEEALKHNQGNDAAPVAAATITPFTGFWGEYGVTTPFNGAASLP
jgi:hypothetical protein